MQAPFEFDEQPPPRGLQLRPVRERCHLHRYRWLDCPSDREDLATCPVENLFPLYRHYLNYLQPTTWWGNGEQPELSESWEESQWEEVSYAQAQALLTYVLARGLAYGNELRSQAEAQAQAGSFLQCFQPTDRFITNTDLCSHLTEDGRDPRPTPSYGCGDRLTNAIFQMGVVALGWETIGILWSMDED